MENGMKDLSNFIHKKLFCTVGDLSVCGILDAGFFITNELVYEPHMHLHYELHFVSAGKYVLENLDGTDTITLETGMAALIPPRYYHNTVRVDDEKTEKFSLRLDFEQVKEKNADNDAFYHLLRDYLKQNENTIMILNLEHSTETIKKISRFMVRDDISDRAMAKAYFNLFITEIVVELTQMRSKGIKENRDMENADSISKRKDAISYILSLNYSNSKFDIKDFAESMNLSERQANRVVVKLYGMSFHQFLMETRLNQAMKLLTRTNLNIKHISELVGYESSTGFFIAFKKRFHVTPGEYRAAKKE